MPSAMATNVGPMSLARNNDLSMTHPPLCGRRVIIIAGVKPRHLVRAPDGPPRRRAVSFHSTAREQREPVMPVTENTPRQLVLKSGSTTLTLDKDAGKATLQRKLLIWRLKPIEAPLSDVFDVTVDTAVDRASGVEVCHTMLVRRTGEAWALPAADKKDAEINASAIRDFLAGQT